MKQYIIKVTVDEQTVCDISGLEDVDEAVKQESGWLHDSGIFVEYVQEIKPTEN